MKKAIALVLLSFLYLGVFAQWVERASFYPDAVPRHHPVTFSIDGYGYMIAGNDVITNSKEPTLKDVLRYDPKENEWTHLNDFPGPRRGYSYGLEYQGKGYMGFGVEQDSSGWELLDDLWEYDPKTDTWTELSPCPCEARIHPALLEVEGVIYMGLGGGSSNLGDWWAYDISTDTWTEKAQFPGEARHHPFYFGIDSLAYVGFGHGKKVYDDFYSYNPRTDKWKLIPGFPGQARVAGTQFSYDGKGYVLSGQGADHDNMEKGEFWEFDPLEETWDTLPSHPGTGRWAPGSFIIGKDLYLMGGEGALKWGDLWSYPLDLFTGLEEMPKSIHLQAFPNPARHQLNVYLHADQYQLSLINAVGQVVYSQEVTSKSIPLQLEHFEPGLYFLRAQTEGLEVPTQRVLIQR